MVICTESGPVINPDSRFVLLLIEINSDIMQRTYPHEQSEEMSLQELPNLVLDTIINHLNYSEIVEIRSLSRSIHESCVRLLRKGFLTLEAKLNREAYQIETTMRTLSPTNGERTVEDYKQYIQFALRHSIIHVLISEFRIIKVFCGRYIRQHFWNFVSRYSGYVLDEFYKILHLLRSINKENTLEPEITSVIFDLNEKFLDHFEEVVEPKMCFLLDELIPFGIKCIDVLDCSWKANFSKKMTYSNEFGDYSIHSKYELRDICCIDFPFNLYTDISIERKLKYLLSSLRNNIRWTNFFYPLKEFWALEDAKEKFGISGLQHAIQQYEYCNMEMKDIPQLRNISHSTKVWLGENYTYYSNEFYKDSKLLVDKKSVIYEIDLTSKNCVLPLDLEFINQNTEQYKMIHNDISEKRDNSNQIKNNTNLLLKVNYPSLNSIDINNRTIIVYGTNGNYAIQLNEESGDDVFLGF